MQGDALEPQTILAIQALRLKGFSVRKCAELLNVSKASVERHGKEVAAGHVVPILKKDREGKLEKIIDLASERLVEELQNSKKISPALLNVIMGTAWDKRYAKEPVDLGAPMNLMISLFGHGVGERLTKSLGQASPGVAAITQEATTDSAGSTQETPPATSIE